VTLIQISEELTIIKMIPSSHTISEDKLKYVTKVK